jgi:hypothetical protein
MKNLPTFVQKITRVTVVTSFLFVVSLYAFPKRVEAASLTFGYVRLDRMKAQAVATGGTICVKPSATHTTSVTNFKVTFSNGNGTTTGFVLNATGSTWNGTTTNLPAGTTAFPGIGAATPTVSGQEVTYTFSGSQTVTGGTTYCFNFGAGLTPRTTAASNLTGLLTLTDSSAPATETSNYATATITDDQIVVTATVPAIFTFSLGANTAALGTLAAGTVSSATGVAVSIGTNAANGYEVWTKGANNDGGGYSYLNSPSTSAQINRVSGATSNATPESLSSTNYGYVVDADLTLDSSVGSGTLTIAGEYNGTDTLSGGTVANTFQTIASSTGTTDGDTVTMVVRARVNAAQAAAADYTETLTVVGAGKF